jgi:hypothetical protein
MEVPQGNFLCSYLKQPQMSFFFFFSYTKSVKRMMQQVLFGDVGTSGSGEEVWKQ